MRITAIAMFVLIAGQATFGQRAHYITYGTSDGLVQSQIRAIANDNRGYLWIGTLGGLSRYDGVEFKNYSKADGLPDNQINCLLQGQSRFWIGSTGMLCYADGTGFHTIALPQGYQNSKIFTLAENDSGHLWIGTAGEGVLYYDGRLFQSFKTNDGLPDEYIRKITINTDGTVWIGTRSGLVLCDGGKLRQTPFQELNDVSVSDITFTRKGRIIVGTFEEGIYIVQDGIIRQVTESHGLISNNIRSIAQVKNDEVWLGSIAGASILSGSDLTIISNSDALPYSNIKCFGIDRENILWFGTDGQGLFRRAGDSFTTFSASDGLCSDVVMQVAKDPSGKLFFGTYDQGICTYDGAVFSPYQYQELLPSKTIWQLLFDQKGVLWSGTSMGLYREESGVSTVYTSSEGLPGNRITALKSLGDSLLVGAERGFAIVSGKGRVLSTFDQNNGFEGKRIRSFKVDGDSIWVGAEGKVFLFYNQSFKQFNIPDDAPVYSLETDLHSNLWIGTSAGLYCLKQGISTPEMIGISQNFSSRHTNFLFVLNNNSLLAGTNNGLYRINLSKYELENKIIAKHYSGYEGLRSKETNQNSVYDDGRSIWFGTTMGAVKFDPNADNFSKEKAPEINIIGLELFLQPTDWSNYSDSIIVSSGLPYNPVLKYNENYITFNYSGIYLKNPDKVKYLYKLDGADQEWLGPTRSRSATYAYLPHGMYTFRIKAFSENDPDLMRETEFNFEITPPYYLTWWFFCMMSLLLILLLWAIYQNSLRRQNAKQESIRLKYQSRMLELESQSLNSSMNRHFIFNALNSIQYYINMQDRKSANKYLTSFARLIRKNLDSSQQNQTMLSEELERLELYLSLEQMRFQGRFTYNIKIEKGIKTDEIEIPAMMLQPFLENSIWHGILPDERHGEIELSISEKEDYFALQIDDNGIGIDESLGRKTRETESHDSKGMQITQSRVALYRRMTGLNYEVVGPIQVFDSVGFVVGTRVIVKLPKSMKIRQDKIILPENVEI